MEIRIGTRGSALALRQVEIIKERIAAQDSHVAIQPVIIKTQGDCESEKLPAEFGTDGVFVNEIEKKLLAGEIDMAVHSAKDIPSRIDDRLSLHVITSREDPRDVLLFSDPEFLSVDEKTIYTSSPRRAELLSRKYPGCHIRPLRGNIDSRIKRCQSGECDAVVLAAAGLIRLYGGIEISGLHSVPLEPEEFLPSAGQGILVCETIRGSEADFFLDELTDVEASRVLFAERNEMLEMGLGCEDAAGAYATVREDGRLELFSFKKSEKISRRLLPPSVAIAGAGPGYPGYMTVRTMELLKECEVLLYDALISEELLSACGSTCEKIYVGKRAGAHHADQEQINSLLVKYAVTGKRVLRLKGGDPFVFGRGGEECRALTEAGIPYEVVPGLSSATAVPASVGIPLTERGINKGFTVVTGHGATDGDAGIDYKELAEFNGSVVFLMGLSRTASICDGLSEAGMSSETPAAVISKGTCPDSYCIRGTLGTIAEQVQSDSRMQAPAILVFGESAGHDPGLLCMPFSGETERPIRVAVAGTESFCREMQKKLSDPNVRVTTVPHLGISPLEEGMDRIRKADIREYSHIVLLSSHAVRLFFGAFLCTGRDLRELHGIRIVTAGHGTSAFLEKEYRLRADVIPEESGSAGVLKALDRECSAVEKVLIPRSKKGSEVLADGLKGRGIPFDEIPIYDSVFRKEAMEAVLSADRTAEFDYYVFASPEGVRAFFENGGILGGAVPICIGHVTEAALGRFSEVPCLVPEDAGADEIAGLIK